ncbi:MAG: RNA polymerase subunit sigma-70 [Planctomycetes bacterium]|nr:RNA polymerase subunit sigma-70 [Planctomycetota bacterium]
MKDDEVRRWIQGLAHGDESAAREVWQRYYEKLVRLARHVLRNANRRMADEEDAAQSAIRTFFLGAPKGQYPDLDDHDGLWKLLVTITVRKSLNQIKRANRQKRGGGAVRGESVFLDRKDLRSARGINEVLGEEPTPELAALMNEQCEQLLGRLDDDSLREVARLKIKGYRTKEIAERLDCNERTVHRKIVRIRKIWAVGG